LILALQEAMAATAAAAAPISAMGGVVNVIWDEISMKPANRVHGALTVKWLLPTRTPVSPGISAVGSTFSLSTLRDFAETV